MCRTRDTQCRARPRLILEDELGRCLCYLDVDPRAYPLAARQWAARLLCELPLSLDDGRCLLGELDALGKGEQPCDVELLLSLFDRYGLARAAQILRAWQGTWQSTPPAT
jgi:hypothetical protein